MGRRILIIAPAWVGDTVMAQPLFARLHQRHAGLRIEVLAPAWTSGVLRHMPEVAEVIETSLRHGMLALGERRGIGIALRRRHYDQAIVLPNSFKSALVPWFARIPQRTGFVGEMRYGLLNDARRLDRAALPMMVERFAQLAEDRDAPLHRPVQRPRLACNAAARATMLRPLGLSDAAPVAAFCPGAEYGPAKRWPPAHFARLAALLSAQGWQVWLLGSGKDRDVAAAIAETSGVQCENLCGRTDLSAAIDLIACAGLVVSNDSGLMHVAAALDRPMVALYGSSSPAFTPPLSDRARILNRNLPCSPCFKRECPLGHLDCLQGMSPEWVLEAADALVAEVAKGPGSGPARGG